MPRDGVPDNAHWVVSDLPISMGKAGTGLHAGSIGLTSWWRTRLRSPMIRPSTCPTSSNCCKPSESMIRSFKIRCRLCRYAFWALERNPKAPCDFYQSEEGRLAERSGFGAQRSPGVVDRRGRKGPATDWPADTPVYSQSPGAAVFNLICINCHGPQADTARSAGRYPRDDDRGQRTRRQPARWPVGPQERPGKLPCQSLLPLRSRKRITPAPQYPPIVWRRAISRSWAWVAPRPISPRPFSKSSPIPRYLESNARSGRRRQREYACHRGGACQRILEASGNFDLASGWPADKTPLIWTNGDALLWQRLCTLNNPAPVRAIRSNAVPPKWDPSFRIDPGANLFTGIPNMVKSGSQGYPGGVTVGTERGTVADRISSDVAFPWCVAIETSERDKANTVLDNPDNYLQGKRLPVCPDELITSDNRWTDADIRKWSYRGAINAGLVVFDYLDKIAKKQIVVQPRYDQCDLLSASATTAALTCSVK